MPSQFARFAAVLSGSKASGAAAGAVSSAPVGAITVNAGASIQTAVNAAAVNAVFWIGAGVHREQRVQPKQGQKFYAAPGCVLNGSRVLTSFTTETVNSVTYNVASGLTALVFHSGVGCRTGYRCQRSEMLYINSAPCKHETALANVQPTGSFYFDETAGKVYFRESTAGKTIEFTQAMNAFNFTGTATDVVVQGFTIQQYGCPPQTGAIYSGPNWKVSRNTLQLNVGVGVSVGNGATCERNIIRNNGQLGYGNGATGGSAYLSPKVIGNELDNNGWWGGAALDFEVGGGKLASCTGPVVRSNYSHHNYGPGLWTDINVFSALYEYNRVEHNYRAGISHEICYDAIIRRNRCVGNGNDPQLDGWLWMGGIQVQNSQNVVVTENYVDHRGSLYGNGICLIYQNRTSDASNYSAPQPYDTINNTISNNTVVGAVQYKAVTGGVCDYNDALFWGPTSGNTFTGNAYFVANPAINGWWAWDDASLNFTQWRGYGFDLAGTVSSSIPP